MGSGLKLEDEEGNEGEQHQAQGDKGDGLDQIFFLIGVDVEKLHLQFFDLLVGGEQHLAHVIVFLLQLRHHAAQIGHVLLHAGNNGIVLLGQIGHLLGGGLGGGQGALLHAVDGIHQLLVEIFGL